MLLPDFSPVRLVIAFLVWPALMVPELLRQRRRRREGMLAPGEFAHQARLVGAASFLGGGGWLAIRRLVPGLTVAGLGAVLVAYAYAARRRRRGASPRPDAA